MSRTRKVLLSLAAAAVAVLAVGAAALAYAASCTQSAAYALYGGSYMDSMLNPPKAEDVEFFTQSGGVPNIMILLDNSISMNRLPPNGPGFLGGTAPPSGPANAGCGDTLTAPGTMLSAVASRVYSSPCGTAVDPVVIGAPFDPSRDYAAQASVCPKWSNAGKTTGNPGFDPDWYCPGGGTSCNGHANFFDNGMVFHDTIVNPSVPAIPDGWSYNSVNPYQVGNAIATVATFCSDLQAQGIIASADTCNTCLNTKGWFYDGRLLSANMDAIQVNQFPSLWYTGRYLNFSPPKFLVARKVLKDTISNFSKVRASIATFKGNGGAIVQPFNPDCAHPDSNFDSNRTTYMNSLDGVPFDTGTPLAKALLDVGLYYHTSTLPWFNNDWLNNRDRSLTGQGNSSQYSICYSCQVSSVIVVTDGVPKVDDDGCASPDPQLPSGSLTTRAEAQGGMYGGNTTTGVMPTCPISASSTGGISTTDCPECGYFDAANDWKNNFTRVAWYLHNFDLRKNDEATKDCQFNGGRQTLDVYALGFNNAFTPGAEQVLSNAAKVGGGIYVSASNATEMNQALTQMQEIINTRATSFSVATLSTLQSQAGHSVIVPRFDPAKGPFWNGHLFRFELYSEFVNNCVPNTATDLDCDGTCGGVFLQDRAGNFIQEDGTGSFKVNEPNLPSCNESKCGAGNCGLPGGADATPWWDSGALLRDRSWLQRKVYTVVDSTSGAAADGRIDAADDTFLVAADDATADKLIPYMNLAGTQVCARLAADIALAGDPTTRTAILADTTLRTCAKEIIRYVLGADVFNSMNRTGTDYPPRASALGSIDRDLLKDRNWKLGDIFHSSPVVVDPPLPSDGVLCARGLSRQCIPSLWATPVRNDFTTLASGTPAVGNAYDGYSKSTAYAKRRKMVVVGANDGMLHAFNGGRWLAGQDDPLTTGIDESLPPFEGYFERDNSGDELWAFIPPDQLSKLHLLAGTTHYLYVDGTPMVRDVWVDGTANSLHAATTADDKKQPWEFHTVVVMNERRGGVHHFALDITDAFRQAGETNQQAPKFLWIYPQPDDPRLLFSGEGYSDFLPTPPPVGPVRVRADSASGIANDDTPTAIDSAGNSVRYHERWVAFLSGGFDPQYLKGRGVHMVDVWTGKEIFDFSYPMSSSGLSGSDPRWGLRYPVPATVAMLQWGKDARNLASFANDGYFDTATFGDAGGQVWVLRFHDPAILDGTTKLATNWLGARVFQMGGRGNPLLCSNEPFFYIAANVALPADGTLRFLAGTGDRYNLLDQYGGTCGPDNIRACLQRGCTVTLEGSSNRLTMADLGDRQSQLSATACGTPSFSDSLGTSVACTIAGKGKVVITCGTGGNAKTTTKDMQYGCAAGTGGYGCAAATTPVSGTTLALDDASNVISQINKFASIRVFELSGTRGLFSTPEQAIAYDGARLVDSDLVQIDGASTAPTNLSGIGDNGWILNFNHTPSVTIDTVAYTVSRPDERVSSTSAVAANCVLWNTTQTTTAATATGSCFVSNCKQINRRIHYLYAADVTTGGLCALTPDAIPIRSTPAVALVPPPAPQYTIFINQKGQVQVGMTSVNTEIGAKNVSAGGAIDPAALLEFLDVPPALHTCRHSPAGGTSPACK